MSIKDLTQKSFSVLIIRSFGVLLLFGFTLFITNFFTAENVGRYDFVRSTLMVLGGLALMGTNQSIIYYSGLLKARKSIESIRTIYFKMFRIIVALSLIILVSKPNIILFTGFFVYLLSGPFITIIGLNRNRLKKKQA